MIYLIEYEKRSGRLATFKEFDNSQRLQARQKRLEIELELNRKGVDREVVLLEAESKQALLRTHRRYFEGIAGIVRAANSDTPAERLLP